MRFFAQGEKTDQRTEDRARTLRKSQAPDLRRPAESRSGNTIRLSGRPAEESARRAGFVEGSAVERAAKSREQIALSRLLQDSACSGSLARGKEIFPAIFWREREEEQCLPPGVGGVLDMRERSRGFRRDAKLAQYPRQGVQGQDGERFFRRDTRFDERREVVRRMGHDPLDQHAVLHDI